MIRGEDEEEETKVNFFDIFASLRKQLKVTLITALLHYKPFFKNCRPLFFLSFFNDVKKKF